MLHGRWFAALLIAVGAWLLAPAAGAATWRPDGNWVVDDRVAVQIYDCGGPVCGRIVWLRNPALRTGQMCGRTIVWGLTPAGPSRWTNGRFFDPENNSTYDLSAEFQSEDTITARIYAGIPLFGHTETLRLIAPRSLPGWC